MKRMLALIILILLLCGCTAQPQEETGTLPSECTEATAVPTEPKGLYEPFSDLEIQTGGAVRSYMPSIADCYGMRLVGSDILLFSGTEQTTLTRLSGDNLFAVADTQLDWRIEPEDTSFQISENGITYYDAQAREVIFLDHDLKEVRRLGMSSAMVGKPVLSSNRMLVYYCTADAVRVFDMETGLDKLIKSVSYARQSVEDILVNDTVLRCSLQDSQGLEYSIFLSAQTGEMMAQIQHGLQLTAGGDAYYAVVPDGSMDLLVFGGSQMPECVLSPADLDAQPWFLEEQHAAVTVSTGETTSVLDYYDLETGLRTASVELPAGIVPWYMESDADKGIVYLMGYDTRLACARLLGWQLSASATGDEQVYTGARYTLDHPDTQGLARCAEYARSIGETHGIQILVGLEAVENQPWDYTLEPEYQVRVIRRELEKLEGLLQHFPQGFFDNIYGEKRICLVRGIEGNAKSGSVEAASGVQFWWGDTACVALTAGETLEYAFFHEMFHVIDNKVLSDCSVYYYWENLNPTGFTYFQDYTSYLTHDMTEYLREDSRAFIDAYSACFPKEDRARVMEYACTGGNAHYFRSEIMQNKLQTLCRGIREAFRLQDWTDAFLWEQYLDEPLAP